MFLPVVFATVSTALACSPGYTPVIPGIPGTGSSSTSAELTLRVAPPTGWTWAMKPGFGQSIDMSSAKRKAENDVKAAVAVILVDNKFAADALKVKTDYDGGVELYGLREACKPDTALGDSDAKPINTFITQQGAVLQTCLIPTNEIEGTVAQFSLQITVTVTANVAVTQTQWDQLAAKLQEKLEAKNAVFVENISADLA